MVKYVGNRTPEQAIREAQKRIDYDTREYPLEVIYQKIQDGEIYFSLFFLEDELWSAKKRSKFIESILIGVPLPPIVLADDTEQARLCVIDGHQRIHAIQQFIENEPLEQIDFLQELNGLTYNDLSQGRQRRFNRTTFRVVILDSSVDKEMRWNIQDRISPQI